MNADSRVRVRRPVLIVAALGLLAAGAGVAYVGLRLPALRSSPAVDQPEEETSRAAAEHRPSDAGTPPAPAAGRADVTVRLSPEAVARAGITTAVVSTGRTPVVLRAPGLVEANAYKQVTVTPLAGGRLVRVMASLGQQVQRGETIAQIFSPELAEAQTRYVSMRAELVAHEQELARTDKLAAIGAASRQDLERAHAEHAARLADIESAAARLQLFGLSAEAIDGLGRGAPRTTTIDVAAPLTGVVTERRANEGLNVDVATPLFTVVDLSSVWVVVNVYESDFAKVRVGSPALVTTKAYPERTLRGRVDYIDPRVSAESRTARARIEVGNADRSLRLGMFAEAAVSTDEAASTPMIPRSAVQYVADRTVVYLLNPQDPGEFVERDVQLGSVTGDMVSVRTGVQAGDRVVGVGSFAVRAERERLGLR